MGAVTPGGGKWSESFVLLPFLWRPDKIIECGLIIGTTLVRCYDSVLMRESLIDRLQVACSEAGLEEGTAQRVHQDIERLFPGDNHYFVIVGPVPDFPESLVEVFLLTPRALVNFIVSPTGVVTWSAMSVSQIAHVTETRELGPDQRWNCLTIYGVSGGNALLIQDTIDHWDDLLQNFVSRLTAAL